MKGLSKILWGKKWKEVKRMFFFKFIYFPFQKHPNMEHSNGHQAWNLPLATKQDDSLTRSQVPS